MQLEIFKKNLSFLELFIIDTMCFFDVLDYPLTLNEINSFLFTNGMQGEQYGFEEITNALEKSKILNKIIKKSNGYYFFEGRDEILESRESNYKISLKQFKIARKAAKYLRWIPFVRFVGICNNLSFNNSREGSDIDFFIITRHRRMYFVRFFATLILSLTGLRRHGKKVKNKICLSFYVTDQGLNLEEVSLPGVDVYLIFWVAFVLPLYDRFGYSLFVKKNYWIKKYLPNWQEISVSPNLLMVDSRNSRFFYSIWEKVLKGFFGDIGESFLKYIQLAKMSANKQSIAKEKDSRVVINDKMLKFHENDRRVVYRQKFEDRLNQVLEKI